MSSAPPERAKLLPTGSSGNHDSIFPTTGPLAVCIHVVSPGQDAADALLCDVEGGRRIDAMSDFIAYVQELFADFGPVLARRMFGGYGLYHDGLIIGVVMDDGLYLKADDATRAQFEAAGSAPFVYDSGGKRVTMSYWSVPEPALDSPQAMLPWARLALQAALRKPAKPLRVATAVGKAAAARKKPPPRS